MIVRCPVSPEIRWSLLLLTDQALRYVVQVCGGGGRGGACLPRRFSCHTREPVHLPKLLEGAKELEIVYVNIIRELKSPGIFKTIGEL